MDDLLNSFNICPGFSSPIYESQYTFRQALQAFAHPGRIVPLKLSLQAPQPLYPTTAALCLTLLDMQTSLWMDLGENSPVANWIKFHCGSSILASPKNANYVLISQPQEMPRLTQFYMGEDEYPEKSATLIIQVIGFNNENGKSFRGPGIKRVNRLEIQGISNKFWQDWQLNHKLFPLGVDIFFTSSSSIVGLPRTIEVFEEEG